MNQIDVLPFQTMSNHLNILLRNLGAQAAPGRDRENGRGAMARERAAGGRRSSRLAPYQPLPAPRGDGQVHAEAKGVDCGNNPECSASNISRVILIWGTGSINSDVMRSGIKRHPYHMNLGVDIFCQHWKHCLDQFPVLHFLALLSLPLSSGPVKRGETGH